jgi:catechol 2,3-dioxygenase-like lactoylglutathione lyase family enzyme
MGRIGWIVGVFVTGAAAGLCLGPRSRADDRPKKEETMELGAFSVSLAVKDLKASRAFYEKLGFKSVMGEPEKNWLILRNGTTTIGLFQGMFEKNIMTFNPGWSGEAKPLEKFQDIREIQRMLKSRGLKLATEADEASKGPASLSLTDPDGNSILLDQHVPRPGG